MQSLREMEQRAPVRKYGVGLFVTLRSVGALFVRGVHSLNEKALRETQTLRAGSIKAQKMLPRRRPYYL